MKHLAIILALTTPAHAASIDTIEVNLDPGDTGVCMTDEGFRPCDGIDTYGAKIDMPPALFPLVSCRRAYDRWVPVNRGYWNCPDAVPPIFWAENGAVAVATASASAAGGHGVWFGGIGGSDGFASSGGSYSSVTLINVLTLVVGDTTINVGCGCVTEPKPPVVPPAPSPVPLPASGLMLLAGLVGLRWRAK